MHISRYAAFPFDVKPASLYVNRSGQNTNFIISNNLDETLDVEIKFLKNSADFELSRTSTGIDPNKEANITVFNNVGQNVNLSQTNVIEITALEQKKEVDFRANIVASPAEKMNQFLYWLLIATIIIILGILGYFGYKYKDVLMNFLKKGSKIDVIKMKIKKLEEKEKHTAIMNMVNILRILNKDDVQIRARLKTEDFTDEEIDAAFAEAESDEEEDDEGSDLAT